MQPVYIENLDNTMKYFICGIEENSKNHDSCNFDAINEISERAFLFSRTLKQAIFTNSLKTVKKEAFKGCEELELFCCGKLGSDAKTEEKESTLKGVDIAELEKTGSTEKPQNITQFTIETSAFANCNKLHTVMLPKCENLIIEKMRFLVAKNLEQL